MWKPKRLFSDIKPVKSYSSALFFERMEPKILLSADALSGFISADPFSDNGANTGLDINQSADLLTSTFGLNANGLNADNDAFNLDALASVTGNQSASNENFASENLASIDVLSTLLSDAGNIIESRQEIIFVDAATPDYQQ